MTIRRVTVTFNTTEANSDLMHPGPLVCDVHTEYSEVGITKQGVQIYRKDGLGNGFWLTCNEFNRMVADINEAFDGSPITHPVSSR